MPKLVEALKENRILEIFGTGTAAIITPVDKIIYQDKSFAVPFDANDPSATIGPYALKFLTKLQNIQYGGPTGSKNVISK